MYTEMIRKEIRYYCVLVLVFMSLSAQASKTDDIRILIDVSGSMLKTDPGNLRVPALRMLNGLIPTGSSAGVWTFGRYVNMEVKWGKVNENWRKQADSGARKIHSRGQFTNIESALKRASSGWEKPDANTRRHIILLTDGKVDISKNHEKNKLSKNNILIKSIPQLVKNGIKVHAIALSNESDEELLKRIALKTSGSFEIAHTAEDLQRIFLRMFERAVKPDTVPLKGNKFSIDKSIREMTLLVFRKSDRKVRLIQPDGKEHARDKHGKQVRWRNDQGYDLITVTSPKPGEWTLDADVDESNRVMIVTDLKLDVDQLPAYSTPDQAINLKVELHNQNKKISKNSFLKFVKFNAQHKHAEQTNDFSLKLKQSRAIKDKGIYLQKIEAPLQEGSHEIIVTADARTFNRNKRFIVEVQWPVIVDTDKTTVPGEYRLRIRPRPEYMQENSLTPEVELKLPDGQLKPVQIRNENFQWAADIKANEQNGIHPLIIKIQGKSVNGKDISHVLEGYSVLGVKQAAAQTARHESSLPDDKTSPEVITSSEVENQNEESPEQDSQIDETESGLMQYILLFGLINALLVAVTAGVYFYTRKNKQQDEFILMDDQEEVMQSG